MFNNSLQHEILWTSQWWEWTCLNPLNSSQAFLRGDLIPAPRPRLTNLTTNGQSVRHTTVLAFEPRFCHENRWIGYNGEMPPSRSCSPHKTCSKHFSDSRKRLLVKFSFHMKGCVYRLCNTVWFSIKATQFDNSKESWTSRHKNESHRVVHTSIVKTSTYRLNYPRWEWDADLRVRQELQTSHDPCK